MWKGKLANEMALEDLVPEEVIRQAAFKAIGF